MGKNQYHFRILLEKLWTSGQKNGTPFKQLIKIFETVFSEYCCLDNKQQY